ncbi:MAG: hypothetical protein SF052_01360 [Bacteroidia bacterium]|nr:hypothetical protein [Bacteroidia bacterium]
MKTLVLGYVLMLCLSGILQAQVTDVQLGMTEAELQMHANPREFNDGFELVSHRPGLYIYANKSNPFYEIQIEFALKGGTVNTIKTVHTGRNPKFRKTLLEYYLEVIEDWKHDPLLESNPGLANSSRNSFAQYNPEVEAFTDADMLYLCVFMFYHNGEESIFTKMERKF